jgi:hypothetical protein
VVHQTLTGRITGSIGATGYDETMQEEIRAEGWSLWSPFRPYYRRDGQAVTVWIDLKGNGATGQATAVTNEEAASLGGSR